jgi:hypothetical protein
MYAFSITQGEQQYFMKSKSYPLSLLNESLSHGENRNELNRHFTSYYVELSKLMMSHVKRQLFIHGFNGDLKTTTEELWAEIFQEHYLPIFKTLPDSAEHLKALIQTLEPPSYDDLFKRKTEVWMKELNEKIEKVMAFLGQSAVFEDDEILEQRAIEVNNDLRAIRQDGYEFLFHLLQDEANHQEDEELDEDSATLEMNDNVVIQDLAEGSNAHETDDRYRNTFKQRIAALKELIDAEGDVAADKKIGCTGATRFCIAMDEILSQIPKILIPTTPMLYWLINNRVRDFMRRFVKDPLRDFAEPVQKNDEETNEQIDPFLNHQSVDSERKVSNLLHDVQMLLQRPMLEARTYLQQSDLTKKQYSQAQARLQRCEDRYSMHMAVFGLLVEGYTQEEIASKLDLTRDQVRGREKEIQDLLKELDESGRKHDE